MEQEQVREATEGKYKAYPKVAIIILNWNGWRDTIECLESLYQITYPNYDVIVVDNGSEDESIEKIKQYCEGKIEIESEFFEYSSENKPIEIIEYTRDDAEAWEGNEKEIENLASNKLILIKNEENYGFAEGNNIGMRNALKALNPEYILLLNNDTVVDKEFLGELVNVGERDPAVGVVGPKIYYYDEPEKIWFAGGKISSWREMIYFHIGLNEEDQGQYDSIEEVNWISGAALMIKSIAIQKLSLLNSKYFFGNEDVEYCIKARREGIKIIYVPSAKIWHKVGVSRLKTKAKIIDLQTHFRFIKENFSTFVYGYRILLLFLILLPKWGFIYIIKYRDKERLREFILNFKNFILRS